MGGVFARGGVAVGVAKLNRGAFAVPVVILSVEGVLPGVVAGVSGWSKLVGGCFADCPVAGVAGWAALSASANLKEGLRGGKELFCMVENGEVDVFGG